MSDHLEEESLTAAIDAAVVLAEPDDSGEVATTAGRRVLAAEDDW